ncbi:MAG: hypothetical protein ACI9DC_001754 [Gammaproteobacteria bacterium]
MWIRAQLSIDQVCSLSASEHVRGQTAVDEYRQLIELLSRGDVVQSATLSREHSPGSWLLINEILGQGAGNGAVMLGSENF